MKEKKRFALTMAILFAIVTLFFQTTAFCGDDPPECEDTDIISEKISLLNIQYTVTLITGDRLHLSKNSDDIWRIKRVDYAPRSCGSVPFHFQKTDDRGFFIIPSDVAHLIPNQLDPTFFNIDYLIENKMDDDNMSFISAIAETNRSGKLENTFQRSGMRTVALASAGMTVLSMDKKDFRTRKNLLFELNDKSSRFSSSAITHLRMDRLFKTEMAQSSSFSSDFAAFSENLDFNGDRVNIAILDSGVDSSHPDFYFSDGSLKFFVNEDLTCLTTQAPYICDKTPGDLFGTGTHVSGIALGTGKSSAGAYKGIAPGARLLNIKIINKDGTGLESHFLKGIERAILGTNMVRGDEPSIEADVVALSFFHSVLFENDHITHYVDDMVKAYNVPIIAAVGSGMKSPFSVSAPGFSERVITVGASESLGRMNLWEENNMGPTPYHFTVKPDLCAPGVSAIGPCTSNDPNCDPNSPYQAKTSTTISSAAVAGTVALLIQQSRENGIDLSVEDIRDILLSTTTLIPYQGQNPVSIYEQGAGILDVKRALNADIILSPARINFGAVTLSAALIKKEVTVKNRGVAPQTLSFNAELFDVPKASYSHGTTTPYHSAVSISPKTATLAPNQSIVITIEVNMNALPKPEIWTVYDGRFTAKDAKGVVSHGVFGFTKEGMMQDLNIKGILPDGSCASHTSVLIFNPKNKYGFQNSYFGHLLDEDGLLSLRVPQGTYNLLMQYTLGGCPLTPVHAFYRISENEVRVKNSPVQIIFDAKKTKPVTFSVAADPAEKTNCGELSFLVHQFPNQPDKIIGTFSLNGYETFSVYSNQKPSIGKTKIYHQWTLLNNPLEETNTIYNWANLRSQDKGFNLVLNKEDLQYAGVETINLYSDLPEEGVLGAFSLPIDPNSLKPLIPFSHDIIIQERIKLPRSIKVYHKPRILSTKILSLPLWSLLNTSDREMFWFESKEYRTFCPNVNYTSHFNERLAKPGFLSVKQTDNQLSITGHPFVDPFNNLSSVYLTWGNGFSISAKVDGNPVDAQPHFMKPYTVPIPADNANVLLTLNASTNPKWSETPTKTETKIEFMTSLINSGELHLPHASYRIDNLSLNNVVQTNGWIKFKINFDTPDNAFTILSNGFVQLSVDDGMTWMDPLVIEKELNALYVEANIPMNQMGKTAVAVKLDAAMVDGINISEVVKNAFILEKKVSEENN